MARLFYAIWPDESSTERLRALAESLAPRTGGRPVPRDNIHLTLAFLGELDDERAAVAATVSVKFRSFQLSLDRLGSFRRARVSWAGSAQAPQALMKLESGLVGTLRDLGFALEERPFAAHVTLLRKIERTLAAEPIEAIAWNVREVTLVASRAGRYEVIERWPCLGSHPRGNDGGE
ncbi:MAG TPA: RNA 2',3'-cyclic phosphodiesterase [Usitatibacter sp.]|nr:RNA 2',3'-cyclic phosphodiesterase [Usitatibacter sp.]